MKQSVGGEAFDSFVALYGQQLIRLAYVMTEDAQLAEDFTQTVLLRMHRRWGAIDHPYAYARRALTNVIIDHGRRRSREVPMPAEVLVGLEPCAYSVEQETWPADALHTLIPRLPPRQRLALVLRYYEHLEVSEIAQVMGIRASSVRSALSRAIEELRLSLVESGERTNDDR